MMVPYQRKNVDFKVKVAIAFLFAELFLEGYQTEGIQLYNKQSKKTNKMKESEHACL